MAFGQPEPIRIAPIKALFERVASLSKLSHFAVEMVEPAYEVSRCLPQDSLKGHLSFFFFFKKSIMLVGPAAYVERRLCTSVYVCLRNKVIAPSLCGP
jgi:hypothetical protein